MAILIIPGMWILGGICVLIMKKIEPEDKIYPFWTLFVVSGFTLFVLYHWFG